MGRRYYCEYCDKSFLETTEAVKKHRDGVVHQRLQKEHYNNFKDKRVILAEETAKNQCNRFISTGECHFGALCKYSHYTREQINALRWEIESSQNTSSASSNSDSKPSLHDWFLSRRKRRLKDSLALEKAFSRAISSYDTDITSSMSWKYPEILEMVPDLPPSLKRIKLEDFKNVKISEWG